MKKILFFGPLSEIVNSEDLNIRSFTDTDSLNEYIQTTFPETRKHTYRIAVNLELIDKNTPIKDNDEIAFLPPFAGG